MTRKLLSVPFGAAALVLSVVGLAFACTNFKGQFVVSGNRADTGTVTVNGTGSGMNQTVNTGVAKSSTSSASVNVSTGTSTVSGGGILPTGDYDINFYNNPSTTCSTVLLFPNCGYKGSGTTRKWQKDCMTGDSGVKLGTVHVNSSGVIDQKNGSAATQPVNFALSPTSGLITNTSGSNESAVCISNAGATIGNQAPLTIL